MGLLNVSQQDMLRDTFLGLLKLLANDLHFCVKLVCIAAHVLSCCVVDHICTIHSHHQGSAPTVWSRWQIDLNASPISNWPPRDFGFLRPQFSHYPVREGGDETTNNRSTGFHISPLGPKRFSLFAAIKFVAGGSPRGSLPFYGY